MSEQRYFVTALDDMDRPVDICPFLSKKAAAVEMARSTMREGKVPGHLAQHHCGSLKAVLVGDRFARRGNIMTWILRSAEGEPEIHEIR